MSTRLLCIILYFYRYYCNTKIRAQAQITMKATGRHKPFKMYSSVQTTFKKMCNNTKGKGENACIVQSHNQNLYLYQSVNRAERDSSEGDILVLVV